MVGIKNGWELQTSWDDDDGEKDYNTDTYPDAHFHVLKKKNQLGATEYVGCRGFAHLPPHLPPNPTGAAVEVLGRGLQAVRLVLQNI